MSILRDWNRFWFKRTSCVPVAMVRILMGILVIAAAIQLWPDRFVWFSEHGLLPFKIAVQYNDNYTAGPRPINFLQYATQDWQISAFFVVYMLIAFCMTIGFCTRTSILLVWIGLNCIHNRDSLNNTTGGDEIMLITTAYMFFAKAGGAISVDRLIRVWRGIENPNGTRDAAPPNLDAFSRLWRWVEDFNRGPVMSIWPQRLMQLQVSVVYLSTFLNKTLGQQWQNGTAVYYPYQTIEFHRFAVPFMDRNFHPHFWIPAMNENNPGIIALMTYGTLAIELSLGLLVWVPRLRLYVLAAGIFLHMGIEYAMNIPLFAFLMIATYPCFLTKDDLNNFSAVLIRKLNLSRLRVVFDGDCEFCRSAALLLRSMDSLKLLRFLDYHDPDELRQVPSVAFEDADDAVIVVPQPWPSRRRGRLEVDTRAEWPESTVDARQFAGFYGFRQIARRVPSLWGLVPLMYIPGVNLVGERVYASIAAKRRTLPVAPAIVRERSRRSYGAKETAGSRRAARRSKTESRK